MNWLRGFVFTKGTDFHEDNFKIHLQCVTWSRVLIDKCLYDTFVCVSNLGYLDVEIGADPSPEEKYGPNNPMTEKREGKNCASSGRPGADRILDEMIYKSSQPR